MHRFSRRLALSFAIVALAGVAPAATIATAQVSSDSWQSLRSGDTVRVWAWRPPLAGTVGVVSRPVIDTLGLANVPGRRSFRGEVTVPVETLTRLEVQRGYKRSVGWTVGGVFIGMAAGALVGAYSGVALECGGSCSGQGDLAGLAGFLVGGTVGALTGGILGGVIGAQRRAQWHPVALPPRPR